MDWKKEYRVSDLFRRADKGKGEKAEATAPLPASAAESIWKKEIHLFGGKRRRGQALVTPDAGPAVEAGVPAEPAPAAHVEAVAEPEPVALEPEPVVPVEPEPVAFEPVPEPEPVTVEPERVAFEPVPEPVVPVEPQPEPVTVEPELAASEPQRPVAAGAQDREPSIWKKEIHLFGGRRTRSAPKQVVVPESSPGEAAAAASQSVWKKEIHLFGGKRRREQPPVEPAAEAEPPVESEPLPQVEEPVTVEPEPATLEADPVSAVEEGSSWAGSQAAEEPAPLFEPEPLPQVEEPGTVEPEPETPVAEPATSLWKKEIRLGRGRKAAAPEGGREKQSRKEKRGRGGGRVPERAQRASARGHKAVGALPDVPLARSLNLLPRGEARTRGAGRLPSLRSVGVALLGLVVVGGLSFGYLHERDRVTEREGIVEDRQAEVAAIPTPPAVTPDEGVELAGEALARAGALSIALDGRIVWDRLLRELSLVLPEGVWFESIISVNGDGTTIDPATGLSIPAGPASTVTISGYSRTQEGLAQLIGRLDVLPQIAAVQLQSGAVVERGDEKVVGFSLVATLQGPEEA